MRTFDEARAAVASGTPAGEAARRLVEQMTPEEKLWCLDGDAPTRLGLRFMAEGGYHRLPFYAGEVERVGLDGIAFADGPRGCVVGNATCFPVTMARGATWDPDLEERVGEAIGAELRAAGANLTGAVCVNLLRHPAWGRAQETYGEEPFHVGEMGAALTRGLQRHVMACVKHFACNSMENARFSVDVEADEVALHEVFLPHFRRIVEEGVAAVMSAYNSVNGEWCGQNTSLLTAVLRGEWGFEGFVISDWIFGLRDAVKSLEAGLDIEMPYRMVRAAHLPKALADGAAAWEDVDAAVARVVQTLLRFDQVLSGPPPDCDGAAHRALAREVAARSVVVLKNEAVGAAAVLPLAPTTRLAVIGELAGTVNLGDGGSSDVWDTACVTVLDGLRAAMSDVVYDDGADTSRAAAAAAGADTALVVVGYTYRDEGEYIGSTDPALRDLFPPADEPDVEARYQKLLDGLPPIARPGHLESRARGFAIGGDRQTLRLHPGDVALIRAVAAANPRTVVAIQAGSAVVMTEWLDEVPAVVQSWYGGGQAGPGLADVLVGTTNPSARLPFTVARDEADLPPFDREATSFRYDRWHGWRHLARSGRPAAFAFGFGLSYTTFELAGVHLTGTDDSITVAGEVRNTGDRDGTDVVQVYADFPGADTPPRLIGFTRVEAPARTGRPFRITIPLQRLSTRDAERHAWRTPAGSHRITVGRHVDDPKGRSFELELQGSG